MHPAIGMAMVFIGCSSNVFFLELLVKEFPGSGNIITFSQFLFISIEGFIFTMDFGRKKPVVPLTTYFMMVLLFVIVQVVNNMAFAFNISVPVHIIFRSGSLIANMILGILILKRNYTISKYLSVLTITAGIIICTLMSAEEKKEGHEEDFWRWLTGIGMLAFAVFMSARMGIYQEQVYTKHGKHPNESLFFNHTLPLPLFLLFASDIKDHVIGFSQSDPISVAGLYIPSMWLWLLGNVITQYVCIKGVFILTTECTSLTVTLVVTLRKFFSLLISIWYFQNPFTSYHWLGTAMVFGGTFIFTEVPAKVRDAISASSKKKSQ